MRHFIIGLCLSILILGGIFIFICPAANAAHVRPLSLTVIERTTTDTEKITTYQVKCSNGRKTTAVKVDYGIRSLLWCVGDDCRRGDSRDDVRAAKRACNVKRDRAAGHNE